MTNVILFPRSQKDFPNLTELEKERARVQILTAYLDKNDPDWRSKIASLAQENDDSPA